MKRHFNVTVFHIGHRMVVHQIRSAAYATHHQFALISKSRIDKVSPMATRTALIGLPPGRVRPLCCDVEGDAKFVLETKLQTKGSVSRMMSKPKKYRYRRDRDVQKTVQHRRRDSVREIGTLPIAEGAAMPRIEPMPKFKTRAKAIEALQVWWQWDLNHFASSFFAQPK